MKYHYQIEDQNKQLFEGDIEADNARNAKRSLSHMGYKVLSLESPTEGMMEGKKSVLGMVSAREKMLFVKHLSLMIKSGMLIDEGIEAVYDQSKGRMKYILGRLMQIVRKGNLLADGLKLFPYTFNDFFVNMVMVGERSGTLEKNLLNLSVKLKKDEELKSKVKAAMMYPMIVVFSLVGLGFAMMIFVLPKLIGLFDSLNVDIPITTKVFIAVASFMVAHWKIMLISFVIFIITVFIVNKLPKTRVITHWVVFHMPISGKFSRDVNIGNFCRSMALMMSGGVTIDEALTIMSRAQSNELYQRGVADVLAAVKRGDKLAEAMGRHSHLFPLLVTRMIHVGELSGNLSETLEYLAEFYEEELDLGSRNLSTLLEPILMVVIGVVVGFVALAIIAPVYQLTSGISVR